MADRVAEWLGRTDVPSNRFTLRDALIALCFMLEGPAAVARIASVEKGADDWLKAFATEAIKAMREPTDAMREACFHAWESSPEPTADALWHRMIDAATDS